MLTFEQRISEMNKSIIYMNTHDLDVGTGDSVELFKNFHINTYDSLKVIDDQESWDTVFKSVNQFLSTLSDKDQIKIAKVFLVMHSDIIEKLGGFSRNTDSVEEVNLFSKNMDELTDKLSSILGKLDRDLNLIPKMLEYVQKYIPIPEFEDAGTNPQDTAAMTFYKPDVEILTSMVVLCKFLAPIFGTIIQLSAKRIDNNYRVFHCYAILMEIMIARYSGIYIKLNNYISNSIKASLKNDIVFACNAMTLETASANLLAVLLTRRFITVDIFTPNSNLMTYIISCARSSISTFATNMSQKNAVREKRDPEEIRGDEGNSSRLENESKNSKTTADVPTIISVTADKLVMDWLSLNPHLVDAFNEGLIYYKNTGLTMTRINKYLLCICFGNKLGGGASIEYLRFENYVKLITMLQLKFISMELFNIIHCLTFSESAKYKTMLNDSDQKIKMSWNALAEYKICKQLFPYSCGDLDWDSNYKELMEYLTANNFIYRTSPAIWEIMNETSKNNDFVIHSEFIMRDLYNLIRYVVNEEALNVYS